MSWRDALKPRPMQRVAVVARSARLRDALVRVAGLGSVEFDLPIPMADLDPSEPRRRLRRLTRGRQVTATIAPAEPNLDELERDGRADLLAGEADLADLAAQATVRGEISALVGWTTLPS